MNLLSTLVLIPLLNPLLRYGGIEGGSTVQLEDRGVNNYFKRSQIPQPTRRKPRLAIEGNQLPKPSSYLARIYSQLYSQLNTLQIEFVIGLDYELFFWSYLQFYLIVRQEVVMILCNRVIRPFCITILYHNLLLFIDIFHIWS